ncbi:hypothetical protein A4X09_0g4112 [Tilletia walkeri]|uniref:Chromo domain-containing protein n=1 Tax=Tilletia walkeri TaxID=117179 RepID=A0A8X7T4K5_9BASI|nr:hypothetical protein A4X09_0g4112 [Tilletia walkeri]
MPAVKRKAGPSGTSGPASESPAKKVKPKVKGTGSNPSSANSTPSRPKARPLGKAKAQATAASKKRAASPSTDSYHDSEEDELDSDQPKEIDEEGSDGTWQEGDDDEDGPRKNNGKKKAGSPNKNGAKGGARAKRRNSAGSSSQPAPKIPRRQPLMIGDKLSPLEELVESDSDDSLASWSNEDVEHWQPSSAQPSGSDVLLVGNILRFRVHPRRGFGQYRVLWKDAPLYCASWETEHIFLSGEQAESGVSQADIFWASMPGGRPPEAPRPQFGDVPNEASYSDTDVQDYYKLDDDAKRLKQKKLRDAWRRDKYQLRKLRRGHFDAAVRAAQAAAFAAGEPIPVIESDEEQQMGGTIVSKAKHSPVKGNASTRGGKAPNVVRRAANGKTVGAAAAATAAAAVETEAEPMKTRSQGQATRGKAAVPPARGSASASPIKRVPGKFGPPSRVGCAPASPAAAAAAAAAKAKAAAASTATSSTSSPAKPASSAASKVMPYFRQPGSQADAIVISDSSDEDQDKKPAMSKKPVEGKVANPPAKAEQSNGAPQQAVASGSQPGPSAKGPSPPATVPKAPLPFKAQPEPITAVDSPARKAAQELAITVGQEMSALNATAAAAAAAEARRLKVEDDSASALFREATGGEDEIATAAYEHSPALQRAMEAAKRLAASKKREAEELAGAASGAGGVGTTAAVNGSQSAAGPGVTSQPAAVNSVVSLPNGSTVTAVPVVSEAAAPPSAPINSEAARTEPQPAQASTSAAAAPDTSPMVVQEEAAPAKMTPSPSPKVEDEPVRIVVKVEPQARAQPSVPAVEPEPVVAAAGTSTLVPEPQERKPTPQEYEALTQLQQGPEQPSTRNGPEASASASQMQVPAVSVPDAQPATVAASVANVQPAGIAASVPDSQSVAAGAPVADTQPAIIAEPEAPHAGDGMLELSPEPEGADEEMEDNFGGAGFDFNMDVPVFDGPLDGQPMDEGEQGQQQPQQQQPAAEPMITSPASPPVRVKADKDGDEDDLWGDDDEQGAAGGSESVDAGQASSSSLAKDISAAAGQDNASRSESPPRRVKEEVREQGVPAQAAADAPAPAPASTSASAPAPEPAAAPAPVPEPAAATATEANKEAEGSQATEETHAPGSFKGAHHKNADGTHILNDDEELQKFLPKVAPAAGGTGRGGPPRRPRSIPGAAAMSSRIGTGPPPRPIPPTSSATISHAHAAVSHAPLLTNQASKPAQPVHDDRARFETIGSGWGEDDDSSGAPAPAVAPVSNGGGHEPQHRIPATVPAAAVNGNAQQFQAPVAAPAPAPVVEDSSAAHDWGADWGADEPESEAPVAATAGSWGDPATAANIQSMHRPNSSGNGVGVGGQQPPPFQQLQQPQQQQRQSLGAGRPEQGQGWANAPGAQPRRQSSGGGRPPNINPNAVGGGGGWGSGAANQPQASNWDAGYQGPGPGHNGGAPGRGGFRGGRGGGPGNTYQGNTGRTPPGAGWGNGGRTPGHASQGGRTPSGWHSGRTTPGNPSSGNRTPGPSNWGADGPGESVAMNISIDAGNVPQQYVQQAAPHMGGGNGMHPGMQNQAQIQMQQQMMAQLAFQQQQLVRVPPPVDYRSLLTPFAQKKFDKWYADSELENKLSIAHDATRAVLQFNVNDELLKKIGNSYSFLFKGKGGMETKMAASMVKCSKGGFRANLDFRDDAFWSKDAVIGIWRAAQETLLTSTLPDAVAPFLNRAKRHRKLTFMIFGSEQPEVECKRDFEVVFPWGKRGGTLTLSLSGLLHHAYHADTKANGAGSSMTLWKLALRPPKNWRVVVHPWVVAVIRLCAEEKSKELFDAIGFDFPIESRWLKELPDRVEKRIKEMEVADTSCGYGADLPEHESVADLVAAVDRELMSSMHKLEMNRWDTERFAVVLAEGGLLHKLEEETKAGVEVLRMDELKAFWATVLN